LGASQCVYCISIYTILRYDDTTSGGGAIDTITRCRIEQLPDIRYFVEVARLGSFNRAAEVLSQTKSAVSKAISRLESTLGARLVMRTTRRVALTDEGRAYLRDCERILHDIEVATDAVVQLKGDPQGVVRIQLPPVWGRQAVISQLPSFKQAYPKIELQIIVSDHPLDPIEDHVDLMVRVGPVNEAGWVVKRLLTNRALTVASPHYLERHGIPAVPADLSGHACIHQMSGGTFRPLPWVFSHAGKTSRRTFASTLLVNDAAAMRDAAVAGMGIVQGPDFFFADAIRRDELRQVLSEWEAPGPTISLVWRQDLFMPCRVRVFIDWLLRQSIGQ
jgi:LysR family transcriptional regulator, regulator for bpeEF and oprC